MTTTTIAVDLPKRLWQSVIMDILHPISPSLLKQLLAHDNATGELTWKHRPESMFSQSRCGEKGVRSASWSQRKWNSKHAGQPALTADNGKGYKVGCIFGKKYRAHNVVWAIHHGEWPTGVIDHIDGNRANNRVENLRDVTACKNAMNRNRNKNSTSDRKGVSYYKASGKWVAYIRVSGKQKHLGYFDSLDRASDAYDAASRKYHGEYGRINDGG